MKKKNIRKYLRCTEDKLEEVQRKMNYIDGAMYFIILGMESHYQCENNSELNTVHTIKDYLKAIRTGELAEIGKLLSHLKNV